MPTDFSVLRISIDEPPVRIHVQCLAARPVARRGITSDGGKYFVAIQRISRPAFRVFLLPIVLSSLSATLTAAFPQERAPKLQSAPLPTGMEVTPTAAPGAQFVALDPGLASYPDF